MSDTPIQVHENHFAKPLERNDILNAPAHLPVPTLRFSVRQISVVWHIYGGSDFATPKPSTILCLFFLAYSVLHKKKSSTIFVYVVKNHTYALRIRTSLLIDMFRFK
ncbi:MAG: hypothetical protein IT281_10685 [Ignavibacteria bacterium]|nr:hypothetical protein [Ignavibacteria bacterium]